ncbi:membrane-bound polysaccharide biosynthesis protein [Streptomyces longisporoflavus]|uniref:Wzz/FepE/Etk N-terminal domain-containing protein n=1 Tax=Streptomyces longisporoflavus TaxID=28044 RepID=UPI00167EF74A|nr:Wzz/FepE/Etk N-terminal domain-containing protein [Streptomyces longisporoflavus]GGV40273.1 membrane-bound polysaccharide biosynthesis protein [Streptomyces longisporoflavus]
MSEDTIRLVTIGRIFRRRWRLLAVVALAGALLGYGASLVLFPPRYTASASVLLPGAWEERELLTQVNVATSSSVVDRAAGALDWTDGDGSELIDQVSAKAADGNIVEISGTADTPEHAQQLADRVAKEFVTFATRVAGGSTDPARASGPEALRKKVEETNRRISELAKAADPGQTVESVQARTSLEKLRSSLEEAMKKLEEADPATGKAGMVVMGNAVLPTGEAPPTRTQLMVGGALLSLLAAVIAHLTAARSDRRLRAEPQIAAALGSTVIGTVDVPGGRTAHRPRGGGPRARARRFLGLDTRWNTPAPLPSDEAGRQLRYRRVCARIRIQLPGSRGLLVVVPDGDEIGRQAAGRLVDEAGNDPHMRLVDVSVSRPVVPDREAESGALVVLSAGSWTAGDLAAIADACADGRHEVVGVVVAGTVRARPGRSTGDPARNATPALAGRGQATGGPA